MHVDKGRLLYLMFLQIQMDCKAKQLENLVPLKCLISFHYLEASR